MKIIKKISPQTWQWMEKNPKKVFKSAVITIIFSLILSVIIEVYFPFQSQKLLTPQFFSHSENIGQDMHETSRQMNAIVSELKDFQKKEQKGMLTQEDSLRILFLNKQYKMLKDEF